MELTALVKDWLNGVLVNNGIALIGNAAGTNLSFDSKENQGYSHEPRLEIELAKPEGDITAVFAGTGLSGGGTSGDVTLSIAGSYQLPQSCANGQVAKSNGLGGWACASDNDSGGDITAVNAGTGLSGGGTSGDVTLSIASSYQLPQLCTIGQVAKSNGAGGWTCANDIDTIGIGGSGTTNFVPKFTASTTIGNSAIFETGGNVGIGTTNPSRLLDVRGDATIENFTGYPVAASLRLAGNQTTLGSTLGGIEFYNQNSTVVQAKIDGILEGSSDNSALTFFTRNGAEFAERVRLARNGNVGIGTTSPTSLLDVNGTLTATTKNFQIAHPLEPDKKLLVHSALEGPEVAVYYRGEAQLLDGQVEIILPAYFEALTRKERRTVQLTPIKGWAPLYVADEIQDGQFMVRTATGGNLGQRFYWEVKAVRADVEPLVVEKLKATGNVNVASRDVP